MATTAPPTTGPVTTLAPTTVVPTTPIPEPIYLVGDHSFNVGSIDIAVEIVGEMFNKSFDFGPIDIAVELTGGRFVEGVAVDVGPIDICISIESYGMIVENVKCNWVKWSKVGRLDFTFDESNEAGQRPMDWKGCVHQIFKLGSKVVVYGDNGVTVLTPSGVAYGMQTIHRLGLVSRGAAIGIDTEHYFIDATDSLYKVSSEGLEKLDYSEYLSELGDVSMALDIEQGLLYICDGELGYVYSTRTKSFGEGPINITGLGVQSGTMYIVAPDELEYPKFEMHTDIYDMDTRKPKTIQSIEVGTDLTDKLEARVCYRVGNRDDFRQTNWVLVNPSGIAYTPCYGVEFKICLRSYEQEFFEIDYIKINGVVHGYSYLDSLAANKRGS